LHLDGLPGARFGRQKVGKKTWVTSNHDNVSALEQATQNNMIYKRLGAYTSQDAYQACM
jgi:hypothetical protein